MSETSDFLRTVGIFSDLGTVELDTLASRFEIRQYQASEVIIHQGEIGDKLFVIQAGFVNVTRGPEHQEIFISALGTGEYFGESALFHNVQRTANIIAFEPLTLLTIDKAVFMEYLRAYPAAASRILYQMLKELFHRLEQTSSELQFERKEALVQSTIDKILR